MTLAEAIAYANQHQPAIRAALARITARMAEAEIPSAQWKPTVGVTAQLFGYTANNTTGTYVAPAFLDIPRIGATKSTGDVSPQSLRPYASTLVGAGISQELFDFGRIGAQRAAADELVEAEKHRADAERLDVGFGVEESFYSVFAAKNVLTASNAALAAALAHYNYVKAGVRAQLRPPIDLFRAEADRARYCLGVTRAVGGLAVAQSVLAAAIGAPDQAVDVSGEEPQARDLPTLQQALQLAQSHDPALAQAIAQLKAAEENTKAIGAELRPDLSATATLSGRAGGAPPSSPTSGDPASFDGWVPYIPNWDVGLILSWPLYDGTIAARRDAAHALEAVRQGEIDIAREQESALVRQAYVQVQVARNALVPLEQAFVAADNNYKQASTRYDAGLGNAVEVADALALRTDADIERTLGRFELARARAAFGRAIAEGL
jgi:outer membrane protein TolC